MIRVAASSGLSNITIKLEDKENIRKANKGITLNKLRYLKKKKNFATRHFRTHESIPQTHNSRLKVWVQFYSLLPLRFPTETIFE